MLHSLNLWPKELLMLERSFTPSEAERNAWQTEDMYEQHIQRCLWQRHRSAAHAILPNYTPVGWHECDLYVVSRAYRTVEYEVKLTLTDFKADVRKRRKHKELQNRCGKNMPNRFFYAVPAMVVSPRDVPDYAGLMYFRWSAPERARRLAAPLAAVIRTAPQLHDRRVTDATINEMRRTAYWRFWNERFGFEDYRRNSRAWAAAKT